MYLQIVNDKTGKHSGGGYKDIIETTAEAVYDQIMTTVKPSLHEVIKDDNVKPYFDIDHTLGEDERDDWRFTAQTILDKHIQILNKYKFRDLVVANASDQTKISFHIVCNDPFQIYESGNCIKEWVKKMNKEDGAEFDLNPYCNKFGMQKFRLPYCNKFGSSRTLLMLDGTDDTELVIPKEKFTLEQFKKFIVRTQARANNVPPNYVFGTEVELMYPDSSDEAHQNTANSLEEPDKKAFYNKIRDLSLIVVQGQLSLDYSQWRDITWALKNIQIRKGVNLLGLAQEISSYSPQHDEEETALLFNQSKGEGFGIGSICQWAKEKNPREFKRWQAKYKKLDSKQSEEVSLLYSSFTDDDIADYFMKKYPKDFIQTDYLYRWKGSNWVESDTDHIHNLISDELYPQVSASIDEELKKADDEHKEKLQKKILKLRNITNRNNYVKSIIQKIKWKTPHDVEFDSKANLIGFKNGIYDLKSESFRQGTREDYITKIINYDYAPSPASKTAKLMDYINKIMPMQDERDCLMKVLSSCLEGQFLPYIVILTGQGGNGKDSLITKLLKATLGNYYQTGGLDTLCRNTGGGLNQGRANMHNKRCLVYGEPSKDQILKCNVLKEISGSGTLAGRGLYSTNTEIKNCATTIIHCNDIPPVDYVDMALVKRILVFLFRSLFLDADQIKNHGANTKNLYLQDRYYQSEEFVQTYKLTFMNVLLKYFKDYKADGYSIINIPPTVRAGANKYLDESDDFGSWFSQTYTKTESKNDYVKIADVYRRFRQSDLYDNLTKSQKRKMNRAKLINEIKSNPKLRLLFRERHNITVNENRKFLRCVIVNYKFTVDSDSDSDSDDI